MLFIIEVHRPVQSPQFFPYPTIFTSHLHINMQADLPPNVTSTDVASILSILNAEMNRVTLAAHLQGRCSLFTIRDTHV